MAYRLLARNQPLSQQLAMAVQGKRLDPPASTPPYQRSTTPAEQGVLEQACFRHGFFKPIGLLGPAHLATSTICRRILRRDCLTT